jgi:hypothetical protein
MFSRIRKRLTFANVAMTLALVFAMSGGAYAAKKYLITSTKQIKPSVLAQLKGKNGANGVNGINGKDGAQGPAGEKGAAGTNGTNGKEGAQGPAGPTGPKGTNGTNGKEGAQGPAGPTGSPWPAGGTLPSGSTETGAWAIEALGRENFGFAVVSTSVSFTIPLVAAAEAHIIGVHEGEGESGFNAATFPAGCKGTGANPSNVTKPQAMSGNLCVYTLEVSNVTVSQVQAADTTETGHTGKTGAVIVLAGSKSLGAGTEGVAGRGTWAVTA